MSRSIIALGFLFLAACASETTPRGADESVENSGSVEQAAETTTAQSTTPATTATPHEEGIPCVPGSYRTCTKTWKDALGVENCMQAKQYCRSDARAWLECGQPYDGTTTTSTSSTAR